MPSSRLTLDRAVSHVWSIVRRHRASKGTSWVRPLLSTACGMPPYMKFGCRARIRFCHSCRQACFGMVCCVVAPLGGPAPPAVPAGALAVPGAAVSAGASRQCPVRHRGAARRADVRGARAAGQTCGTTRAGCCARAWTWRASGWTARRPSSTCRAAMRTAAWPSRRRAAARGRPARRSQGPWLRRYASAGGPAASWGGARRCQG